MADDADMPEGVTIDRSNPDRPQRNDKRSVMKMLHDELQAHFGAKDATVTNQSGQRQNLMDAVDDAVKGAPAPGSQEY